MAKQHNYMQNYSATRISPVKDDIKRTHFPSLTLFDFRKSVILLDGLIDLTICKRVCKIAKANISFVMNICLSVCMSVRLSAWNNSVPTGRNFRKFRIRVFFEKYVQKI